MREYTELRKSRHGTKEEWLVREYGVAELRSKIKEALDWCDVHADEDLANVHIRRGENVYTMYRIWPLDREPEYFGEVLDTQDHSSSADVAPKVIKQPKDVPPLKRDDPDWEGPIFKKGKK